MSIIKKNNKHDTIVLLAKNLNSIEKLNSIEVLISNTLNDLYPSHDEFF